MSDQEFSERSVSKAKIIIFWATWCLPCRVELARIQKLLDYGFISKESVLAIAFNEEISLVEQVSKKRDYAFPIVVDEAGELAQKLNISLTPTILLVEGHRILWMSSGLSLLLELRLMLQGVL